jgi:hypothetical protein
MRDPSREANKIPGRCSHYLPADLNGERPLLYVERLLLAPVMWGGLPPPGGTDSSAMKKAPPLCSPVMRNLI